MTYVRTLRRIRQDKTNYRKRAALLIGRQSFVTVKVSDQNVAAQLLKATPTGDMVIASAHSRQLAKQGWKGSLNSLPACYLTGLILGKKALQNDTKNAVVYTGKDHFTTRVAACVKGITDAGVSIPVSKESLPPEGRISGQHIAEYATALKEDQEKYNIRFSALLKNGLSPEDYPAHFEEIKTKIAGKAIETEEKKEEKEEAEEKEAPAKTKKKKAPKEKKEKAKKEEKKKAKKSKGGKKKK